MPKQSRTLGITLRVVAVIAALITAVAAGIAIDYFDATSYGLFGLLAASGGVGAFFWNWGSRHLAPLGEEALKVDPRPPIVYLRSFANEKRASDAERAFAKMFHDVGPFVAIGAPGEKLPPLGAARLYLEDENWKRVVSDLVGRAQLVIIYGGNTPGLGWELTHVKRRMDPKRTIIMVPNAPDGYEKFRALAASEAELELAPFPSRKELKYALDGTAGFVRFSSRWAPFFVALPKAAGRGRGSFVDDNIEGARTWAALSGICNVVGIKVGKPPRNWGMALIGIVRGYLLLMLALIGVMVVLYFAGILVIEDNQRLYFDWPEGLWKFAEPGSGGFDTKQK